jgi:alkanesulfonate monooxygenase SsuD/methylene tetrahydromethanopterin reductase-like flavin-dependent oxidoreductase (luciferase family)
MKIGLQLHTDRGTDYVLDESIRADQQGYDSVWLWDHLMDWRYVLAPQTPELKGETRRLTMEADHAPNYPFESFTLMSAVAAVTSKVKLTWATLNLNFRLPAVQAKMLTTLDHISHGRVIPCVGSGWYQEECEAYNIPLAGGHYDRILYAREVIQLWKQLWSHPAPEKTTFEGQYVQVMDLPFNPAPYENRTIPFWWGGDSDASIETVKQYCDGWMTTASTKRDKIVSVTSSADWPDRPITLIKGARLFVGANHEEALEAARLDYERARAAASSSSRNQSNLAPTFEDFVARETIGSADECIAMLAEMQSWGLNYIRLTFNDEAQQERVAQLILPRLDEVEERAARMQAV